MDRSTQIRDKLSITKSRKFSLIAILFFFMLLHQTDKYLISPLTTPIMEEFGINEAQMGLVFTGALLVGGIFYPIWGYLFDRYARPKILALAALVWGSTTWLSAIAGNFGLFAATRASTGIDDASYPGVYSLVSDYFEPTKRGKIISVLQLTSVLGSVIGLGIASVFRETIGWRGVFYITGSLGLVSALLMYFGIQEVPRGQAEPEMQGRAEIVTESFKWETVKALLKKPTMVILFFEQCFAAVPFAAIGSWFYRYLEVERMMDLDEVFVILGIIGVLSALSGVFAGTLGDWLFKKSPRGRMIVSLIGVIGLMISFTVVFNTSLDATTQFYIAVTVGGFFFAFEWPNAVSTIQDITEPEIRSTAHGIIGVAEITGASLAPLLVGVIAVKTSLGNALLTISAISWVVAFALLIIILFVVPKDVARLREIMKDRASTE